VGLYFVALAVGRRFGRCRWRLKSTEILKNKIQNHEYVFKFTYKQDDLAMSLLRKQAVMWVSYSSLELQMLELRLFESDLKSQTNHVSAKLLMEVR
jgi:hypothetical protein